MRECDEKYLEKQDVILSSGELPSERAPFTRMDKIRAILKIKRSFTQSDIDILNSFLSSDGDRYKTIELNETSETTLYRLLKRVDNIFEPTPKDPQTRG